MPALSSWLPLLLRLLVWFAVGSLIGLANYWLFYSRSSVARFLAGSWLPIAVFVLLISLATGEPYTPRLFLLAILPLSFFEGLLEGVLDKHSKPAFLQFLRALAINVCALASGTLILGIIGPHYVHSTSDLYGLIASYGAVSLAPFSLSFFRWMFKNAALKPGVDRHLHNGEFHLREERL